MFAGESTSRRRGMDAGGMDGARCGDYRVSYTTDDTEPTVTITAVQHRADVYRRRQQGPRR